MVNSLNMKKTLILIGRIALLSLAIAGIGYISSVVSRFRCENAVALSLLNGPLKNHDLYLIYGDGPSQAIFSRVGTKPTLYTRLPVPNRSVYVTIPQGKQIPRVTIGGRVATAGVSHAIITFPFLASVQYIFFDRSNRSGAFMSHYLCLFGGVIKIREDKLVTWE